MELSVENCGNLGKGLRNKAFIPKGVCFLIEECFCSNIPDNTDPRIGKIMDSGINCNQTVVFVASCLTHFKKKEQQLITFLKTHSITKFRLNDETLDHLNVIATIFKKDIKMILDIYYCVEDNAFSSSFLILCTYFDQYLYNKASYANHQCINFNTEWIIDPKTKHIKLFARRDIQADEWITITYSGGSEMFPYESRTNLHFKCQCLDCITKTDGVCNLFGLSPNFSVCITYGFTLKNLPLLLRKFKSDFIEDRMKSFVLFGELIQIFEKEVDTHLIFKKPLNWPQLPKLELQTLQLSFNKLISGFHTLNVHEARLALLGSLCIIFLGGRSNHNYLLLMKILKDRQDYYDINESEMFGIVVSLLGF